LVPVRSNAAWFGDTHCQERLTRQIKTYLVLYDRIIFENARYRITAGRDGQGVEVLLPGTSFPGDRSQISFFSPGAQFGVSVDGTALMSTTLEVAYEVDFFPMLHRAGLENSSFIEWSDRDITPGLKNAISQRVSRDLLSSELCDALPPNKYLGKQMLQGLYRDSLLAHFLKTPFCVAPNVTPVLLVQRRRAKLQWMAELPGAFFEHWLNMELPDFAAFSWDDLADFRESRAGVSFRRMVHDVCQRVTEILPDVKDQRDLDHWLAVEFNRELLTELFCRMTTRTSVVTSICLNFLPFGFIPAIAKDVRALFVDQASWLSVVRPPNRNG